MNCKEARKGLAEAIEPKSPLFLKAPHLWLHVALCKDCRSEARRLQQGLRILGSALQHSTIAPPETIKLNVMKLIEADAPLQNPGAQNPVSFRNWIAVGFFLIITLCCLPFSSEAPLVLVITVSIFLTLYGSLFIGSHLEELAHHFGLR